MLSGRGLCDELITRPEESYRLCCVVVCDLETSRMGTPYIYIYDISRLRVNFRRVIRSDNIDVFCLHFSPHVIFKEEKMSTDCIILFTTGSISDAECRITHMV